MLKTSHCKHADPPELLVRAEGNVCISYSLFGALIRLSEFTYMPIVTFLELALLMVAVVTYFNPFVVGSSKWVGLTSL